MAARIEPVMHSTRDPPDREPKDPLMTSLVLSVVSCSGLAGSSVRHRHPPGPSPADVVAALETAMADAIARAEPSVVAIHRDKAENSQETQAVRGRKRSHSSHDSGTTIPSRQDARCPTRLVQPDLVRLRVGRGHRRPGRSSPPSTSCAGPGVDRPRSRAAGIRRRDHRRRPAQRPGRDRARPDARAPIAPGSSPWRSAMPPSCARARS